MKEPIEYNNFELIIGLFRKVISSLSCIEKKTKNNNTRCICSKYLNDIINQYDNYKLNKDVTKICFKYSEKEVVDFCNEFYDKIDIFEFANEHFNDNCYELTVLRWFRDNYVSKEDIEHYYKTAPIIVEAINNVPNNGAIYNYIYNQIVSLCVSEIKNGSYDSAYSRYKNSILSFEEIFAKPLLKNKLAKTLKKVKK